MFVVYFESHEGSIFSFHNFEADGLFFDTNNGTSTANPVQVRIIDPKDPIGIGFVLPGKTGSKIVASNAVPALVASYVVPSGVVFDAAALPTGWYENFGDVSLSNLVFDTGSSLAFPFFGAAAPLAISGKLTLTGTGEIQYDPDLIEESDESASSSSTSSRSGINPTAVRSVSHASVVRSFVLRFSTTTDSRCFSPRISTIVEFKITGIR